MPDQWKEALGAIFAGEAGGHPANLAEFISEGAAYMPALVFQFRQDYTHLGDRLFYGWLPGEGSRLFQHAVSAHSTVFLRNTDGTIESASVGPGWNGQTRIGATFDVRLLRRIERLRALFALTEGVTVPAGDYTFYQLESTYSLPFNRLWSASAEAVAGSFYDGRRLALEVQPAWSLSRHLDLSGAYRFERVAFRERDRRFNVHVARLRVETSLNTELSGADFNFDQDPPRLEFMAEIYNADNPDLEAFQEHGGRLLMWHSWPPNWIISLERKV